MALRHFLLGRRCVFCGQAVDPQETGGACELCAQRLRDENLNDVPNDGVISLYLYRGIVRDAIHRLKYGGQKEAGRLFGERLADRVRDAGLTADLVACVPRAADEEARAYNPSEVLARAVAARLRLPVDIALIAKKNGVRPQSSCRSRFQRARNARHAFLPGASERDLTGKRVLLVDDVYTTGATAEACAAVLKARGAAKVTVLSAVRSVPGRAWTLRPCPIRTDEGLRYRIK